MLIFPVIVATGEIGFEKAWQLTSGSFWRLLGLSFLFSISLLPFALVIVVIDIASLVGVDLSVTEDIARWAQWFLPIHAGLQAVFGAFYVACGAASLSFAYKALLGIPADAVFTKAPR